MFTIRPSRHNEKQSGGGAIKNELWLITDHLNVYKELNWQTIVCEHLIQLAFYQTNLMTTMMLVNLTWCPKLVTDYLTKMGIKTVPQPPYSPDLAPCDFWLFPMLRGYRYETIEEMKDAVTKVIDTLTQEDFHVALKKLLEWYNKCIAAGGDYFEGG